jgi:hypothetical protein
MTYKKLYALLCWCQWKLPTQQPVSGMTRNICIEKNLRELLMASQTGTIFLLFSALGDIPSLMYTSNKLFPDVIDTFPSDIKTRGHTFSRDLDWLSCSEQ